MKKLFVLLTVLTAISLLLFVFVSIYTVQYIGRIQKTINDYKNQQETYPQYSDMISDSISYLKQDRWRAIAFLLYSASTSCICPIIYCIAYREQFADKMTSFKEDRIAHREAKREERQAKKRQRLQEKLERISKGHESEP